MIESAHTRVWGIGYMQGAEIQGLWFRENLASSKSRGKKESRVSEEMMVVRRQAGAHRRQ